MTVQIVEITGRARQGVTQPFICRGEDGNVYFVKGAGAGRRSQICELVAGQLAASLGLPIAPFEIVDVPRELIDVRSRDDLSELGPGLAFGSCRRAVTEVVPSRLDAIPLSQQMDVLAFDWWVRNADRTLSETGGNPNLFWDVEANGLVVIDHNQAFDAEFSVLEFLEQHAFAGAGRSLFGDWIAQAKYVERFEKAYQRWPAICATVPSEWMYVDAEQTVKTDFDFNMATQSLLRYQSETFWSQE